MTIETDRLHLAPLNARQLRLWAEDIPSLERELNCRYRAEPVEGAFLDIVKGQLDIAEKDAANYLYHTFWFLIRKTDRIAVGSAGFKNVPGKNGEVEIGYGLGKGFERNGYMAEAVRAMCGWAMAQDGVSNVIAETDAGNQRSHNVLKRCGFAQYRQGETLWWRSPL